MPSFTCAYREAPTPLAHVWEHTVGSGHAALALRADWQAQLRRCRLELGFRYVRFHALLSHPTDTLTRENGKWLYSFFNSDQILDFVVSIGMKPFIELSFMPPDLASGGKTAFHYRANVTPPKSYRQWARLIRTLARHWIDRYGRTEVSSWFFEVWNEPNLDVFGSGRQDDYFKLYRITAEALKSVDSRLRVGGPVTANSAWIKDFVAFVDRNALPADFISTHQYPTDAFGSPGDDTETQLSKSTPGFMRERAMGAAREAGGRPLHYTEWCTSSNPRDALHDEPFAAAFAINILMSVDDLVDGYSWWTFSDIFDENYMPSLPFQGGFGLLNIHAVAKPVYRAFELLHRLGSQRFAVDGSHHTVTAWVVGDDVARSATVLLTNHALPRHRIETEHVRMRITGAPAPSQAWIERIDATHANAAAAWRQMHKPEYLHRSQIQSLQAASELVKQPIDLHYDAGTIGLEVAVPTHAVAAITIRFGS